MAIRRSSGNIEIMYGEEKVGKNRSNGESGYTFFMCLPPGICLMKKFDAIIIGSGQAGTPLAFKMASQGKNVAFIEKEHFGGTCVNDGCTPTKAYVASARRMRDARNGEDLGVHIPEGVSVDLKKVKARKDALVKKSADGISKGLEARQPS